MSAGFSTAATLKILILLKYGIKGFQAFLLAASFSPLLE